MSNVIPDTASAQIRVRRSQAMRESSVSLLKIEHKKSLSVNRSG